jgi:DNA polymerase-3 subunit delta'
LLDEWLRGEGCRTHLTFEPGDTEVGRKLRQIVLDPATGELSHRTEVLLYAADKAEHVDTVVRPALDRGEVVITDRYVDSSLAYQGAGRALDGAEVEWVQRWATADLRPHLTVVLDLPPEQGLGRFAERDRIEGESLEFHQRVRAGRRRPRPLPRPRRPGARRGDQRRDPRPGPAAPRAGSAMTVWDSLVGQRIAVAALATAAGGQGMSHAWLFTGPPGSGRSNAAIAFAAALECEQAGCGDCHACRTVLAGSHADVSVIRTEKLSIGVDEVRDLVRRAALAPVGQRWQVMIVEDADRLTDQACNALLKAIEEPTDRTVWMLCAPTVEDVLPTIRSRCRHVTLTTPTIDEVAAFLVRTEGVAAGLASYAARASQGHIGRARALARDADTRNRRHEVVTLPARLTTLGACMTAATNLHEVTKEEAALITGELDAREKADLDTAYGVVERGRRPREYAPALAALEKGQKTRAKRRHLDVVDRSLMDLASVYRDAIAVAVGATGQLVNEEIRGDVDKVVRASTPELNLRRIGWIFDAREQMLEFNVPVPLALESMMLALKVPEGPGR